MSGLAVGSDSMPADEVDGPARWSCVDAMFGGSSEGTLKPGAPMVNGSKDSAEESDSVMNLDSSELKRERDADAEVDAEVDADDEDGSAKLMLPL